MSKKHAIWLACAVLAGCVALAVIGWRAHWFAILADQRALAAFIERIGPWGPAVVIAAIMLQVILAPMPGQAVTLVAGYLYGPLWGTLMCLAGLVPGTLIVVWLARRLGRPLIERVVGPALLEKLDLYVHRRGALALLMIFLLPFLPDDLACYVAGLTPLRIGEIVLLALIGRAPGVLVATLLGSQARDLNWTQLALVAGGGLVLVILFARYQAHIESAMFRLLDRLTGRAHRP